MWKPLTAATWVSVTVSDNPYRNNKTGLKAGFFYADTLYNRFFFALFNPGVIAESELENNRQHHSIRCEYQPD